MRIFAGQGRENPHFEGFCQQFEPIPREGAGSDIIALALMGRKAYLLSLRDVCSRPLFPKGKLGSGLRVEPSSIESDRLSPSCFVVRKHAKRTLTLDSGEHKSAPPSRSERKPGAGGRGGGLRSAFSFGLFDIVVWRRETQTAARLRTDTHVVSRAHDTDGLRFQKIDKCSRASLLARLRASVSVYRPRSGSPGRGL
jgi:hypothetical protein